MSQPSPETSCQTVDVTILLAARDRLALLKESVASALAQDYPSFEVLVVDDGSGPETRAWLDGEAAIHPRLRVVHQPNQGVATARQNGLLAALGRYVCILDSDDKLRPEALRRIMDVFEKDPGIDLVYTDNVHVLADGTEKHYALPRFASNADMIRATFLRPRLPFKHSGTTYRRDAALALGGYDTRLPIKIDVDFFLRYLSNGKRLHLLNEPLVEFRMHRGSISAKRVLGIQTYFRLIDAYGPEGAVRRLFYKAVRASLELSKKAYLLLMPKG